MKTTEQERGAILADLLLSFIVKAELYGPVERQRAIEILDTTMPGEAPEIKNLLAQAIVLLRVE